MDVKVILLIILVIILVGILVILLFMSLDFNVFFGVLVGLGDLELFKILKERGFKKVFKWLMVFLGFIFLVISIVCWVLVK